jgi:hypothetical protein
VPQQNTSSNLERKSFNQERSNAETMKNYDNHNKLRSQLCHQTVLEMRHVLGD